MESETVTKKSTEVPEVLLHLKSLNRRLCFSLDFEAPTIVQFMVDRQVQKDER